MAVLEAKAPEKPLPGKAMTLNSFSRDTFIDYDLEVPPELATFQRKQVLQGLLARRGEVEAAIREAKAGPPEGATSPCRSSLAAWRATATSTVP